MARCEPCRLTQRPCSFRLCYQRGQSGGLRAIHSAPPALLKKTNPSRHLCAGNLARNSWTGWWHPSFPGFTPGIQSESVCARHFRSCMKRKNPPAAQFAECCGRRRRGQRRESGPPCLVFALAMRRWCGRSRRKLVRGCAWVRRRLELAFGARQELLGSKCGFAKEAASKSTSRNVWCWPRSEEHTSEL